MAARDALGDAVCPLTRWRWRSACPSPVPSSSGSGRPYEPAAAVRLRPRVAARCRPSQLGLRASEIGMLQLRDYDPKAAKIFVHRLKGSNSGEHHLMREEAQALRAWLKVRGSFPGPIFLSKQKRPIDRTTLHLLMKKYAAATGIPDTLRHFHVLKHCCATYLLSKGFGVERVQDWIGHANIQSTMEYAKVANARGDDMAQQLKETWR